MNEMNVYFTMLYATRKKERRCNTTNTRIRKLRKALDLTQQEFAARIGTSANVLTNYETGRRNPSSSVINNICKEFHVREDWLRTGSGEMFLELSRDDEIAAFVDDVLRDESDSFRKRLIYTLSRLDVSAWEVLERMAEDMARQHADPPPGYSSREEMETEVDQEVERYRQQLLLEKLRESQASSARGSGAG